MALNDSEKNTIIQLLDNLDDKVREVVLASLDALASWLQQVAYSIYKKVKNTLRNIWEWLMTKL